MISIYSYSTCQRKTERVSAVVERDCENEVYIKEWSTLGNNKSPAALYYYCTWNALHLHGRNHAFSLRCVSLRCDDHIFGASIVRDLSVENMSYFDETCYGNTNPISILLRYKVTLPKSVHLQVNFTILYFSFSI